MEEMNCPYCGKSDHKWHRVYYESATLLQELKDNMISYCEGKGKYVIADKKELVERKKVRK